MKRPQGPSAAGLAAASGRGARRGGARSARAARVVTLAEVASGDPEAQPDSPEYAGRFLAEGDSWFSINAVPKSANVLDQLRLALPSVVFNLAQPGDTIRRMGALASNPLLARYLARRNFASNWDAILLSGGGNDLIEALPRILVPGRGRDPANWINSRALAATLRSVTEGYAAVVASRDARASVNAGKPIVAHTYDYPTANNAPARFFGVPAQGPWFWTRFREIGLSDPGLRDAVIARVLDRLAETLLGLRSRFAGFRVADTRGTLARAAHGATGNSNDWLNEIHPNSAGYRKIARRIAALL